jgi:hypothetical protein
VTSMTLAGTPKVANQLEDVTEADISTTPLASFPVPYLTNFCLWPGCKSLQKEFLTSQDLDFHIQTYHMRQCPWPTCNIQRSFRRRSDLLRHMECVHSGVRRFVCDLPGCHKTYARGDKLTAHKRSHFNKIPGIQARSSGLFWNERYFHQHPVSPYWKSKSRIPDSLHSFHVSQEAQSLQTYGRGSFSGSSMGPWSTEFSSAEISCHPPIDSIGSHSQGTTYSSVLPPG